MRRCEIRERWAGRHRILDDSYDDSRLCGSAVQCWYDISVRIRRSS